MSHFPFQSVGYFRPLEDWWGIITCDPEIIKYYSWLAKSWGIAIEVGSRHGPHISVIKGERPRNKARWFALDKQAKRGRGQKIEFRYSNQLRHNGYHAWLDVQSPALSDLRVQLGLKPKPYHSFHLTIGRLKLGIDHELHEPRPKNLRKKLRKSRFKQSQVEIIRRK